MVIKEIFVSIWEALKAFPSWFLEEFSKELFEG